jgi:hypothetical protein
MSENLLHVRAYVVSSLTNVPNFSCEDIKQRLLEEQQYLDSDRRQNGEPSALSDQWEE